MLTIKVAATLGAGHVNEDAVGWHGDAAWVIDGATGVGDPITAAASDAAWYAGALDAALRRHLAATPDLSTRALLRAVIVDVADRLAAERIRSDHAAHELPSAALVLLRVQGDGRVELTSIGDCQVAYRDAAGTARLFEPTDGDGADARARALVAARFAADEALTPAAMFAALLPDLQARRRLMNTPGGYWIMSTDPAAADHAATLVVEAEAGATFVLASDGFLRLEALFGEIDPAGLLALDTAAAVDAAMARLRAVESDAASWRRFARVKLHDDASFLAVTVT